MMLASAATSVSPDTRSARPNARRFSALARHLGSRCNHAPRPGIRRCGSGRTVMRDESPRCATTLSRSAANARRRHPTQVRTGAAGRGYVSEIERILTLNHPTLYREFRLRVNRPGGGTPCVALSCDGVARSCEPPRVSYLLDSPATESLASLRMSIRHPVRRAARRAF